MKFKKFFTAFALTGFLMAGALVSLGAAKEAKAAKAESIGEVTISEVRNAISSSTAMYLLPTKNYELPDSWDNPYVGAGEEDGVFLNGTKIEGAALKYAGTGSAFITFYYGLPRAAVEGDVVEFKGTFTCESIGKSFTMSYAASRFAETWVHALEDYDVVSLKDANMPDFENVALNTDDSFGGQGAYVTDPAGLPKQKGFFGLTNNTGSYAFQFYYQKSQTGTGWFDVIIGASGTLYSTGHFIDYGMLDAWAETGHAQIHEYLGSGDNWAKNLVQETGAIALGWNVGEKNLIEVGLIKVRNSELHYVFIKVNGALKWGGYWELEEGGMTTKVCLLYGGTDAKVTNSIEPEATKLSAGTYVPEAKQLYVNMDKDICPEVHNWADYFMPVVPENFKLNGTSVGYSNWNYFKKTGAKQMFLALGDIGVTPVEGDVLYFGGLFKAARTVNGVKTLFKVNFEETYLQYLGGDAWTVINPNYEAADFSKDLLKMTLSICTGVAGDNHDALAEVWAVLADASHYGALALDEKDVLSEAVADKEIVVPTTAEGVDEMNADDAVAAAMYRYDYCTSKYNLSSFIDDRPKVPNTSSNYYGEISSTESNSAFLIIAIVASAATISLLGVLIIKKRKQR